MKDVWPRVSPSADAGDPPAEGSDEQAGRTNKRNRYRKYTIEFYRWSLFTCLNPGGEEGDGERGEGEGGVQERPTLRIVSVR